MAEKEKPKPAPAKNMPKDGQVIIAILKEMGVTEYEPKTIVQLTEFVYRYGSTILEEARVFANNSKKRLLDLDDVRLALQLQSESTFTMPPPREVLLECARNKNNNPLPLIKPPCGLRLPPDRHCLSSANYVLKGVQKKPVKNSFNSSKPTVNIIKRTNNFGIQKQTVSIPKPVTKISNPNLQPQKTVLKPKIQITQTLQNASSNGITNSSNNMDMKRKREEVDD
ncbi:PREDICTED: transcription initiation factor TFIID subunit 9 [Nicrophorus vespilloides]|uniref:Transcription initiation factor TFIID subunit 9 n=1 Tax=Nicrophorus vespilloides TaxID=110193 RepID=A0ABM1ME01_NICVS|nr:PREDICTED: transcription initiation factor TFIID subunit 9 [Nicrophorus vespilloides]